MQIETKSRIGLLLGDAFLERSKQSHNARLRIEQSYP